MECKALIDPERLFQLICEVEAKSVASQTDAAYVCGAPSAEDPGRRRLWVIPKDTRLASNPGLWTRDHQKLLEDFIDRGVVHASIVFAGEWPRSVERHYIRVPLQPVGASGSAGEPSERRLVRREVRVMSAPAYLWVDRLGVYDERGEIDLGRRSERLAFWAGRYWTDEREASYIPPKLHPVDDGPPGPGEGTRDGLLATKPRWDADGFIVIYGQGGAGKTHFLGRLARKLSGTAAQDLRSGIPVLVQLGGILHQDALEIWLSRHGFEKHTLKQMTALLKHGVVIPLLDALDEVVKGEARQGSDEFLDHVFEFSAGGGCGRGLLACRDYYLTTDRAVVRDRAGRHGFVQLFIGAFDSKDTRRFLQVRTGLPPDHASRWADALEREAKTVVGEGADLEVIRHPVVLETLAQYIIKLPTESRVTAADDFQLSRQNIFGDIVDNLLKRERQKFAPLWQESFGGQLQSDWVDAFDYRKQRDVFRKLTLLIAEGTAAEMPSQDGATDLRHGLFMTTKGVPQARNRTEAWGQVLSGITGLPEIAASVPEEQRSEIQGKAFKHLAEAYAGHILANTEPHRPDDLVFALRHRFYFDYFLADALLGQITQALETRRSGGLVDWCMRHHVTDSFATCLDFLSWDSRVAVDGWRQLRDFLSGTDELDEVLASYLVSLGLAILLRRQGRGVEREVQLAQLAPKPQMEILLMNEFLPKELSHFKITSCTFPKVVLDSLDLANVDVESCDFVSLRIHGKPRAKVTHCRLSDVTCDQLVLDGTVTFSDTSLDIDGEVVVHDGARVDLFDCEMTDSVRSSFERARDGGARVTLQCPRTLAYEAPSIATRTPGRRFVNKLMSLLRKEGHAEFGVYYYKLRDRTPGTGAQFDRALSLLEHHGCLRKSGPIIEMTDVGAAHMYQHRMYGRPDYNAHDDYWGPIVRDLDYILTARHMAASG
jgi:hypothetical protein